MTDQIAKYYKITIPVVLIAIIGVAGAGFLMGSSESPVEPVPSVTTYEEQTRYFSSGLVDQRVGSKGELDGNTEWMGYTKDDIFVGLIENEAHLTGGHAIFQLRNPSPFAFSVDGSKLIVPYLVEKGKGIDEINVYVLENVTTQETNTTQYLTNCQDVFGKGGNKSYIRTDCDTVTDGRIIETTTEEFVPLGTLTVQPYEVKTFKVEGTWSPSLRNNRVDWFPQLDIGGTLITQTSWAWWNSTYNHYQNETITNGGGAQLTNYPVYREFDTSALVAANKLKSDCIDLEPINESNGRVDFQFEDYHSAAYGCDTTNTSIWTISPQFDTPNENITWYYNNSNDNTWSNSSAPFTGYGTVHHFVDDQDSSGNGHSLTRTAGGSTFIENQDCPFGGCLNIQPVNQVVNLGDDNDYTPSGSTTIEVWVNIPNTPGGGGNDSAVVSKWASGTCGGTLRSYEILYQGSVPRWYFAGCTAGGGDGNHIETGIGVIDGTPQYLAMVLDTTNDNLIYYLNGDQISFDSVAGATGFANGAHNLYIGANSDSDGVGIINQYVDEFRIGNFNGSAAYIKNNWLQGCGNRQIAGCSAYVSYGAEQTAPVSNPPTAGIERPTNTTYVENTGFTFNFTANSTVDATFTLTAWVDDNQTYNNASYPNGTYQTFDLNLLEGTHNFTVKATDSEGSDVATAIFTTDYTNEIGTTVDANPFETQSSDYEALFEYDDGTIANITGALIWNSTNYGLNTGWVGNTTHIEINKSIDLPLLSGNNNSAAFAWWSYNVTFDNGTVTTGHTSANDTQNVQYSYHTITATADDGDYLEGETITIDADFTDDASLVNVTNTLYYSEGTQISGTNSTFTDYQGEFTAAISSGFNASQHVNASFNFSAGDVFRVMNASAEFTTHQLITAGCNATVSTQFMRLLTFDEVNVSDPTQNISVDVTFVATSGGAQKNMSFDLNDNRTYHLCMSPAWAEWTADGTFQYQADSYPQRTYYTENYTINNVSKDVELYVLGAEHADLVSIEVRGRTGNVLEGALVSILRYYPDTNEFRTVEIIKTDSQGQSPAYLTLFDVFYKFLGVDGGAVIFNTDAALISSASIELVATGSTTIENFVIQNGIASSCDYAEATRTISCSWSDTAGVLEEMCLHVFSHGNLNPVQISEQCSNSVAGSLGYALPSDDSIGYSYSLLSDFNFNPIEGNLEQSGYIDQLFDAPFAQEGLFFSFLLFLTVAGVGLRDPRVAIVLGIFSMGVTFWLGMTEMGVAALIGMAAVGIFVLWKASKND